MTTEKKVRLLTSSKATVFRTHSSDRGIHKIAGRYLGSDAIGYWYNITLGSSTSADPRAESLIIRLTYYLIYPGNLYQSSNRSINVE